MTDRLSTQEFTLSSAAGVGNRNELDVASGVGVKGSEGGLLCSVNVFGMVGVRRIVRGRCCLGWPAGKFGVKIHRNVSEMSS